MSLDGFIAGPGHAMDWVFDFVGRRHHPPVPRLHVSVRPTVSQRDRRRAPGPLHPPTGSLPGLHPRTLPSPRLGIFLLGAYPARIVPPTDLAVAYVPAGP